MAALEFTIAIAGREYRCAVGPGAVAALEAETGLPAGMWVVEALQGDYRAAVLLAAACLATHHNDLTLDELGELIRQAGGILSFSNLIHTAATRARQASRLMTQPLDGAAAIVH